MAPKASRSKRDNDEVLTRVAIVSADRCVEKISREERERKGRRTRGRERKRKRGRRGLRQSESEREKER